MTSRDELCGRRLGEFILRERIAEGGFGAVYRAEQALLGREAVVKVLHSVLRSSDVVQQRFMREAQLASRLDHPYAAHVYAFGVDADDGLMWIAMELVHGTPLHRYLSEHGRLSLDRLLPFIERVAEVVHTAHERGIVHRDLKPSNIMVIERAGRLLPKLLDFGIAKLQVGDPVRATTPPAGMRVSSPETARQLRAAGERPRVVVGQVAAGLDPEAVARGQTVSTSFAAPPQVRPSEVATVPPPPMSSPTQPSASSASMSTDPLTRADATMGSPPYMPPEQWNNASLVGPRSDLYSLAIIAYEALTGRRPFRGTTLAELAMLHAVAEVPPLGDGFPVALDALFQRALAKDPAHRPATALELVAELRVAAGLEASRSDLPRLDEAVRDSWIADAPQPLAEAVAALDAARNVHQARDAARETVRILVRYLVALAIASRAQVRGDRDEPTLVEFLRAMRHRDLGDSERLELLRLLVRPFAGRAGAHPIPPLVQLVESDALDPLDRLQLVSDVDGSEAIVRSQLIQIVGELTRMLRACAFVLDHPLVVPRAGVAERWTGLRRQPRAVVAVSGAVSSDGQPALVDRDGRVAVLAWPLVQAIPPMPGLDDELFVFDGRGRLGARLTAAPTRFEHHDASVWDWLADHVLGEPTRDGDATSDDRAPYLGLASFSETDADRFVGREREIDVFLNRLRRYPLQIVVGASGAGKSSFVRAGVLPTLPPGWRLISLRPGATPLATLTTRLAALARTPGTGAIAIVVDQLEELFTLCDDPSERERFATTLVQLVADDPDHVHVIATLRDDFLMDAETLAPLRAALATGLFLLGNPSHDDLVRTIVEPARRAGYTLSDPELAADMVAAVAHRPGALAVVSFTASRLWELRDRRFRQLTRGAYDAMGGIGGALGQHADAVLDALSADEQRIARDAFRHLVTAGGTRAALSSRELRERLADPRAAAVIDKLVAARLFAVSDGEGESDIEIIHEALIAAWPRLQQWIRDNSEHARTRDELRAASKQWHDRGEPRGLLWRDDMLVELERWRRAMPALTEAELVFADASRAEARRARLLRRGLAAAAFTILVVAIVLLVDRNRVAAEQTDRAESATREMARRVADQYVEQSRLAVLSGRSAPALLYAIAAIDAGAPRDAALDVLIDQAARPFLAQRSVIQAHAGPIRWMELSPTAADIVTAGEDKTVKVWDAKTSKLVTTIRTPLLPSSARFDPRGRRIIVAFDRSNRAQLWTRSGELIREFTSSSEVVEDPLVVTFDHAGTRVVTYKTGGIVELWNLASGESRELDTGVEALNVVEFSPDDRTLAAAGTGITLVDVAKRTVRRISDEEVGAIEFSGDGKRLASASFDHTARVWDVATGTSLARLQGHADVVEHVSFDDAGGRVVTASRDGSARVWGVPSGELLVILATEAGAITTATFQSHGQRVVTATADGSVQVWDPSTGAILSRFAGHKDRAVNAVLVGEELISAGADGTLRRWDATPRIRELLGHRDGIRDLEVSEDRRRLVTASHDGTARIFDIETGETIQTLTSNGILYEARFGQGSEIATGSNDGTVTLWRDGAARHVLRGDTPITTFAFSADHRRLLTGSQGGDCALWDVETGRRVSTMIGHRGPVWTAVLSPRGDRIATAGVDGVVHSWSPSGRLEATFGFGDNAPISTLQYQPASDRVAFGTRTGRASVWTDGGALIRELPTRAGAVRAIASSPDGAAVAIAGDGERTEIDSAGPSVALVGHAGAVTRIAYGLAEGLVVSAGADDTVRIWEANHGRLLSTARLHRGGVWSLVVRDHFFASGGRDGSIVVTDFRAPAPTLERLRQIAATLPVRLSEARP